MYGVLLSLLLFSMKDTIEIFPIVTMFVIHCIIILYVLYNIRYFDNCDVISSNYFTILLLL